MKRDILAVTEGLPQFFIAFFSGFMHRYTNVDVVLEMEKYKKKGVPIVLCTAAPVCYVSFFSKKFRFLHVFATPSVLTPGWKENIGKEKLASLEKCFGKNLVIECVITDHHDDLPLLLLARKRILVAPSKSTLSVLSGRFEYEVIS